MKSFLRLFVAPVIVAGALAAHATVLDISIGGGDAIFLSGRTDLVIPPASDPWFGGMIRHSSATPEEIQETLPPFVGVTAGDVIRVLDPAVGGINFFRGFGPPFFGPDGNQPDCTGSLCSDLFGFGAVSGYLGPEGALVGVFLDDTIPALLADRPSRLDFSTNGLGREFSSLNPGLGQVFYIGNGVTSANVFQEFIAPTGATRLFVGIPDGFGFDGAPGAYDDNDGAYRIRLGINQIPSIPEPGTLALIGLALALGAIRPRVRHSRAAAARRLRLVRINAMFDGTP